MPPNFSIDIVINPAPTQHGEYLVELREGDMSLVQIQTRIDRKALLKHELSFSARGYGIALHDMVFTGKVGCEYQRLLGRAGSDSTVRIQLVISDYAPELHALPWERLFHVLGDKETPLAASAQTPFSRFLRTGAGDQQPVKERPLRLLLAIANPQGLPPGLGAIDVAGEVTALADLLAGTRGQVTGTVLPGRSGLPPSLRQRLEKQGWSFAKPEEVTSWDNIQRYLPGHHVLHILAHGQFRQIDGQAFLLLEDEGASGAIRGVQRVADHEIVAGLMGVQPVPHLIFLASCDSAKRLDEGANPFVGLGWKLVQAGAPAVVAMQDLVSSDLARTLSGDFYRRLFQHGRVDRALNEARSLIFEPDAFAWSIPVLFLHMKDGQLWAPDPDWSALRDAMQGLQADDTFAYVADDRGTYLRLPVDLAPLARERFLPQRLSTYTSSAAGILFEDAMRMTLKDEDSRLVVVTGHYGSNLTTQLKRFAWQETCQALSRFNSLVDPGSASILAGDVPLRLPIFASLGELRDGRARYPGDPVLGLVLHKLQGARETERAAQDMTPFQLERLFSEAGLRLVLVLDDDDTLSEREQRNFYTTVFEFLARVKEKKQLGHKVILAVRPASLEADGPFSKQDFQLLGVQRMARQKVRHFLQSEAKEHPWAESLLNQIDQSGYFDLIAVPWFLVMLVEQARSGFCPRSRTEVITTIVDDAIDQVVRDIAGRAQSPSSLQATSQGLEENVRQIVYELAWQMQFGYMDTTSLADTLVLIERHRGHRQYGVELLYSALVKRRLLAPKGSDGVRFAYGGMQSYCCAKAILRQPSSDSVLEHVMAGVGRLTRLRWWEDTLVFACGLMASSPSELNRFLKVVVYGMDPQDNEQVFLAARCVGESTHTFLAMAQEGKQATQSELQGLAEVVATALIWRLDSRSEPRSAERTRAAELLGQTTNPPRVRELVQVAYCESRWDRHGLEVLEHSDVRMAAVAGLFRLTGEQRLDLLRELDKRGVLEAMLKEWNDGSVQELAGRVREGANVAAQGIAALALGDLYGRLVLSVSPDDKKMARVALNALTAQFQDTATHDDTMWALTYALAMIGLPTVTSAMVNAALAGHAADGTNLPTVTCATVEGSPPLSDERVAAFFQKWSQRDEQQKFLAYLIGLAQWSDPHALRFLHENCLRQNTSSPNLAAVAIDALSRVGSAGADVSLLEKIALGDWDDVLGLPKESARDCEYLQRKALEALASQGDIECINRLRRDPRLLKWSPSLQRALYVTSENIIWRLYWNRGMYRDVRDHVLIRSIP